MRGETRSTVVVLLCLLQLSAHAQDYNWYGPGHQAPEPVNECTAERSSCRCCLMLQQINELELYFQESLDKVEEVYQKANRSFNHIVTNRVAFSTALFDNQLFKCFGPMLSDVLIPYRHVFLNLGGGYDSESGTFRVPTSGVYSVALTVHSDAGAAGHHLAACAGLLVNGQSVAGTKDNNHQDQEDSSTVAVALRLQAGDVVNVLLPAGCFLCDERSHFNTFSAFLLYAE